MRVIQEYIDKEHIRQFYEYLGLRQYDLRLVREDIGNHSFVDNFDDFLQICLKNNFVKNIFVGINEREKYGKTDSTVIELKNIFIDIDPVRRKSEPSDDIKISMSYGTAMKIKEWFRDNGFKEPSLVFSGNGHHLYAKIKPVKVNNANRHEISMKYKVFGNMLIQKFSDANVRVDNVFNLSRVARLPGTVSLKYNESRMCKIIDALSDEEDSKLRDYILSMKLPEVKYVKSSDSHNDALGFDTVMMIDNKFNDLFNGRLTMNYPSRSEAEQALVCKCIYYGLDADEVLSRSKIGKWNESTKSYKRSSIENARNFVGGAYK